MTRAAGDWEHVAHCFAPVYDARSRVLVLGTLPSVKSREAAFYYGHPRNRFWPLTALLFAAPLPTTVAEKRALLLENGVALWDVVRECDIRRSSDSTIRNAVPNDLTPILEAADIRAIYTNGSKAKELYDRLILPRIGREATALPSTSPANAARSLERLAEVWQVIARPPEAEVPVGGTILRSP